MLLVKSTKGILFYVKKLRASEEPEISLCEMVRVPSISITKAKGLEEAEFIIGSTIC